MEILCTEVLCHINAVTGGSDARDSQHNRRLLHTMALCPLNSEKNNMMYLFSVEFDIFFLIGHPLDGWEAQPKKDKKLTGQLLQGSLIQLSWASLMVQTVKNLLAVWETWVRFLGWEDPLEKGMETHSRILPWKIPWTEEPGRLQSMELQRVVCDWATSTFTFHRVLAGKP